MDNSYVYLAAAGLCGGGIVLGVASLVNDRFNAVSAGSGSDRDVEKKDLGDISCYWTDRVFTGDTVYLERISILWREPEEKEETEKFITPSFRNKEIERFCEEYVTERPAVRGARRKIIVRLLHLLDEFGDCPSVVGKSAASNEKEGERELGDELYNYLALTPLWKHSLHVARFYAAKMDGDTLLPNALIIALGHDIAKIPKYYGATYKSAEHSSLAHLVLLEIPEYASLPNAMKLGLTIQAHHYLAPGDSMAAMLKAADQEARKLESEGIFTWLEEKRATAEASKPAADPPSATPAAGEIQTKKKQPCSEVSSQNSANEPITANVLGNPEDTRGRYTCNELPLPSWWDKDVVIEAVQRDLNRVIHDNSGRAYWNVFSEPGTGHLWATEQFLWEVLKAMAKGTDASLLLADGDKAKKRDYLYTIVRELGREKLIDVDRMAEGYYTVPVNVVNRAGSIPKFLIPFVDMAFPGLQSDREALKSVFLEKMVTKITIKGSGGKLCSNT